MSYTQESSLQKREKKKKERNNPNSIELTVKNLFKITQMCKDFLKDKN